MKIYNCAPTCPGCGGQCSCCTMPGGGCRLRITSPTQLSTMQNLNKIEGDTYPYETVRITIDSSPAITVTADESGRFSVDNPNLLLHGAHSICVWSCPSNCRCCVVFYVDNDVEFVVQPISATMGRTFRTIDIDVWMYGTTRSATVYYLLLPPGSPAPTASEIMNYQNTAALLDGTAATGEFVSPVTTTPKTYTWVLTGLDKPGLPVGTTGVVDGYRYDVYLYVVSRQFNSGVLSFPDKAVMGMPFATGRGTPDNPFTIRQLTPEELQKYPDLLAGNPLNRPGVDEYGRQLENIERLITLYEETDGYYGLGDSMELNYLMTSDLDLSVYASAYNGAGWEPIGDTDGWINDRKETEHIFSGVFDGDCHTISNLSITPKATRYYFVGYRGLFGAVENGTIKNLKLRDVTIDAYTTVPGFAQLGSFISTSHNPVLKNLTLTNANLVADSDTSPVGNPHMINMGGFVAAIYDGATVSDIKGEDISISVPSAHALALGGFVGYTDKHAGYESYENINLSRLNISGYAMIGGFAGYIVYGVDLVKNVKINDISISAPGGMAGGLIGQNRIYEYETDEIIEDCAIRNVVISIGGAGDPGNEIGGLIGKVDMSYAPTDDAALEAAPAVAEAKKSSLITKRTAAPAAVGDIPVVIIRRCSVSGGEINCANSGGGLIGYYYVSSYVADNTITLCKTDIPVKGTATNVGGLVGFCVSLTISQSFTLGPVSAGVNAGGGLTGSINSGKIQDCYSTSIVASAGYAGGIAADSLYQAAITRCYHTGNVLGVSSAGGIAGGVANSSITNSLVLGGAITASSAHRILGSSGVNDTLQNNYALSTVTPIPASPDSNGPDGGTIVYSQIVPTMQSLGWDTSSVWNTASVTTLGRPTLVKNPE